jgi:hypothetical protein
MSPPTQVADQRVVGRKERMTDQDEKGGVDGEVEELEAVAQYGGEDALGPIGRGPAAVS